MCPSAFPYAFGNGKWCCAYDRERYDQSKLSRCDGGPLEYWSECCAHYASRTCAHPPCRNYKPCTIQSVEILEDLRAPEYMGSEVVGIVSGGSCTGRGEADLSITQAKSIEESYEVTLSDRADVDWSKSSSFSLVGMPAFWSFGAMIGGTWTNEQGGKRSVTESRTKTTSEQITKSSGSSSPYRIPGAGLLVATTTKYKIDRKNVPVKITAKCAVNPPKTKDCVYDKVNLAWGDLYAVNDLWDPGNYPACLEACRKDPKCSAFTYTEFLHWFVPKSKCWLKKPGHHGPSACPWLLFYYCKSAKLAQCGDSLDPTNYATETRTYSSTMDFKSFSYDAVHFTPMNTAKAKSIKCTESLISCIKRIPQQFRAFFGKANAAELEFKSCVSQHGKKGR